MLYIGNYRLGVLGFMSLGTAKYSGNQGLKDQQLALKWVHDNIHLFGGDANKITMFGQSSGSASAYFHSVNAQSRQYINQSIQMSFTFDVYTIFKPGHHRNDMYAFAAEHADRNITNDNKLIEFLKSTDFKPFIIPLHQYDPTKTPITVSSEFIPVNENAHALQPFMQFNSIDLLEMLENQACDSNVMLGGTTAEALLFGIASLLHPEYLDNMNANFAIELPNVNFNGAYSSSAYKNAAQEIRNFYFPHDVAINTGNWSTGQAFIQMMSNIYQNYPTDRRVKVLANKCTGNDVYYYRFGLDTNLNFYKKRVGAQQQYGACHGDDLCYVFHCRNIAKVYESLTKDSSEYQLIEMMTSVYTNFAKYGNPTPNGLWRPVKPGNTSYMNITMDGLKPGINPLQREMHFWNKLIENYSELFTYGVNKNVVHAVSI